MSKTIKPNTQTIAPTLNRRSLIKALALSGAGVSLPAITSYASTISTLRPLPPGKLVENFIRHNDLPWALETLRGGYGYAPITPQSAFFVRNNLPLPPDTILDNRDAWRVEVKGAKRSGSISLAELKTLPTQIEACVLQCSGNGRAFFEHKPSGSPWAVGAAGCALWTGVRLSDVIAHFGGPSETARYLTATGAEPLPAGVEPSQLVVERSVPLSKGLKDCLLVWEMNGAPLPLVHGGPVRLIVPGYFGVNNVKWVKQIGLTEDETGAHIQASGYRFRDIGESGGPQHPSMWRMPVKSWLNGPGAENSPVEHGAVLLHGVAFSGERGIARVEVSADDGKSWQDAELLSPDLGPNAWRSFVFTVNLQPGEYRFVSRATDREGDTQPREATVNQRGYGHNGWHDPGLTLQVVKQLPEITQAVAVKEQASTTAVASNSSTELSPLATEGRDIFLNKAQPGCGVCHQLSDAGSTGAVGPNLNTLKPSSDQVLAAVKQGVGAMPSFKAQLTKTEMDALAAYVAEAAAQ